MIHQPEYIAIALTDSTHIGDNGNAIASANAFAAKHGVESRVFHQHQINEVKQLALHHSESKVIVFGAGEQQLQSLAQLSEFPNITTSWSGHQAPASLEHTASFLDSIHLPAYAVPFALKHRASEKLITTPHGVPNLSDAAASIQTFEAVKSLGIVPEAERYVVVALGGNTTDNAGITHAYTAEEAFALGQWAGSHALTNNAVVLATDSPRTSPEATAAFKEGLATAGIAQEQQCFLPYQRNAPFSGTEVLFGAVLKHEGSYAFMPGDSSSMLTEAVEQLPAGATVMYRTNSMSEAQQKQSDMLLTQGYAHRIDPRSNQVEAAQTAAHPAPKAADMVADKLTERLQGKTMQQQPAALIAA